MFSSSVWTGGVVAVEAASLTQVVRVGKLGGTDNQPPKS